MLIYTGLGETLYIIRSKIEEKAKFPTTYNLFFYVHKAMKKKKNLFYGPDRPNLEDYFFFSLLKSCKISCFLAKV